MQDFEKPCLRQFSNRLKRLLLATCLDAGMPTLRPWRFAYQKVRYCHKGIQSNPESTTGTIGTGSIRSGPATLVDGSRMRLRASA